LNRRRNRLLARVLLALALICAQYGALAHTYSHRVNEQDGGVPNSTQTCATCLSFAPLLGAAHGSHHVQFLAWEKGEPLVSTDPAPVPSRIHVSAFRSRAPPVVL
jgi:hypothetical protein